MNHELPTFVSDPHPEIYLTDNYLVLDVETTNREHGSALDGKNSLLLACWTLGSTGEKKVCWGDEFSQRELLHDIAQAAFVVCWNNKFEYGYLRRCGYDLRTILGFDGMIAEKVIHGNIKVPLSLDGTAARRGLGGKSSTVSNLIKAGVCPSQIPQSMLQEYCEKDVALTQQIFLQQREELGALSLLPVMYCRCLVTPVLADIEFNGMELDPKRVAETYDEYATKYASLEKEFAALTGGINPKSGKQMREHVYGKLAFAKPTDFRGNELVTDGGQAKVDKATLASLHAVTDEQKEFKRLAVEIAKLKVPLQNLTKMKAICEETPDAPRMYFTFNQCNTDTDRLSSTARRGGMQGQNIDSSFKRLFKSGGDGRVICEADSKQLEFRMAVHLGRCKQGLADVLASVDVHQVSADYHGVTRKAAKARTFRPLFGGKSGTPRERKYIEYFTRHYDGISNAQREWALRAVRDKYLVTETGYRFYFPEAKITSSGYIEGTTKIYNYPIQNASTGELIPLAVAILWHLVGALGDDCRITNSIHDSVVAEVGQSVLVDYKELVKYAFTAGVKEMFLKLYGIRLTVPLGCEVLAAKHWADTKEKEDYDPDIALTAK